MENKEILSTEEGVIEIDGGKIILSGVLSFVFFPLLFAAIKDLRGIEDGLRMLIWQLGAGIATSYLAYLNLEAKRFAEEIKIEDYRISLRDSLAAEIDLLDLANVNGLCDSPAVDVTEESSLFVVENQISDTKLLLASVFSGMSLAALSDLMISMGAELLIFEFILIASHLAMGRNKDFYLNLITCYLLSRKMKVSVANFVTEIEPVIQSTDRLIGKFDEFVTDYDGGSLDFRCDQSGVGLDLELLKLRVDLPLNEKEVEVSSEEVIKEVLS